MLLTFENQLSKTPRILNNNKLCFATTNSNFKYSNNWRKHKKKTMINFLVKKANVSTDPKQNRIVLMPA